MKVDINYLYVNKSEEKGSKNNHCGEFCIVGEETLGPNIFYHNLIILF